MEEIINEIKLVKKVIAMSALYIGHFLDSNNNDTLHSSADRAVIKNELKEISGIKKLDQKRKENEKEIWKRRNRS
jgi:hypothetical protein